MSVCWQPPSLWAENRLARWVRLFGLFLMQAERESGGGGYSSLEATLAHVSRKPMMRLKTGLLGRVSILSATK